MVCEHGTFLRRRGWVGIEPLCAIHSEFIELSNPNATCGIVCYGHYNLQGQGHLTVVDSAVKAIPNRIDDWVTVGVVRGYYHTYI